MPSMTVSGHSYDLDSRNVQEALQGARQNRSMSTSW
jgi:hypothetical protein